MTTFPDVSRTFPGAYLERSTLPDNLSISLKGSGNVETSGCGLILDNLSRTLPDGRPVQTGPIGGGLACLERIVQAAPRVEA